MVIKNRLRFFLFFFSFVLVLFLSVKSCVKVKPSKYVEVEADKVSPVPKKIENTQGLVNFIEEVKESTKKEEELSLAAIEKREKALELKNRAVLEKEMQLASVKKEDKKKQIVRKSTKSKKKKKTDKLNKSSQTLQVQKKKFKTPSDITLSGGHSDLNGYSKAKLESYANRVKFSSAKKIYITGYHLGGENKLKGFARAEKVKSILISSGLRNKTIYVFSKKAYRSPSSINFDWSLVSAKN